MCRNFKTQERGDYVAMVRHQVYHAMTPDTCGRTRSTSALPDKAFPHSAR